MVIIIYPYKLGSRGAKELRTALNVEGVKTRILKRQPNGERSLIVNWGNAEMGWNLGPRTVVNHPMYTAQMSDKLKFFNATAHDPEVVEWTTDKATAEAWKSKVFVRHLLNASGGRGIEVIDGSIDGSQLSMAPLYTKHQPRTHEYRVHVVRRNDAFSPILVQRKVFKKTAEQAEPKNWDVRNHDNGFIFQAYPDGSDKIPKPVTEAAINIMSKYFRGLHFCALDVLYNSKSGKAHVLEGNTAPGLENNTVKTYAQYLTRLHTEYLRQ